MQDVSIDSALEFLHSHLSGFLKFDGERVAVKIIVANSGQLFMPVMEAMLLAVDTVLELPDDADEHMQLIVTLARQEEAGRFSTLCDRWRAYHGEPEDVRWASVTIDSGRLNGWFLDEGALLRPNPLEKEESALLRRLNAQPRTFLKAQCAAMKVPCENPTAVGVDPGGIDIRRLHDVGRLRFPVRYEQAAQVISWLEGASQTPGLGIP
ncbi:MAG: hypothetical protein K8R92_08055 [Planctomycetes bacterium]|nr:hypothetical protein [Planctomycetota bacterium]